MDGIHSQVSSDRHRDMKSISSAYCNRNVCMLRVHLGQDFGFRVRLSFTEMPQVPVSEMEGTQNFNNYLHFATDNC